MEHRRFLVKRGLKKLFRNKTEEAEEAFVQFHDLVNNSAILHPVSHILLVSVALKKRDRRLLLEHSWLAICAPIVSVRNIFVQNPR